MALQQDRFETLRNQLRQRKEGLSPEKFEVLRSSLRNQTERKAVGGLGGFALGVGKSAVSTLQNVGHAVMAAPALIPSGKTYKERLGEVRDTTGIDEEALEARGTAEKAGKFVGDVAQFAVPATQVVKITKGANLLIRLGSRILSAGTVASAQSGEVGKDAAIAGGVEAALPVAGKVVKPVFSVVKRLFKGLGSGLSGVGTDAIDTIVKNPRTALSISRQLEKKGNFSVLEDNARAIVKGVSKIRQDAREAYGAGLKQLKEADIAPKTFRSSVQKFLDSIGSSVDGNFRDLSKVEFTNPRLIQKASDLIERLSNTKLDGASLNKLLQRVNSSKYKTTGSDPERLAYNAFIKDFSKSIKDAIGQSTKKLDEINKAFSTDMQLVEGIERIFGKIKFKNLKEVDAVAIKLESLFSQKGLNPRVIDEFLLKIGIKPADFRTSEAVRQIGNKTQGVNTKGLTISEILQQVTSSVITPSAIKNTAILTGLSEQVLKPMLEAVAPSARATLIKFLINNKQ